MPRKTQTKKTVKKTAVAKKEVPVKKHKDLRFSLSLVVLIGMLTFSMLLLLVTLDRSSAVSAKAMTTPAPKMVKAQQSLKTAVPNQTLNDSTLDFRLSVPSQLGKWSYRTGEVESLTDDSLSDQYVKVYIPVPGAKTNNFDDQNQEILVIRRFSKDEWADIEKSCDDGDEAICGAGGQKIDFSDENAPADWVYAYSKADNCPKNLNYKCALADSMIKSIELK